MFISSRNSSFASVYLRVRRALPLLRWTRGTVAGEVMGSKPAEISHAHCRRRRCSRPCFKILPSSLLGTPSWYSVEGSETFLASLRPRLRQERIRSSCASPSAAPPPSLFRSFLLLFSLHSLLSLLPLCSF